MAKESIDKNRRPTRDTPPAVSLEKEIQALIDREKTKRSIVEKLLNQKNPPDKISSH